MAKRLSAGQSTGASALRKLADHVEQTGKPLPRELATAVSEALEDGVDREAVRAWHERRDEGEKTISSGDLRRKLGL